MEYVYLRKDYNSMSRHYSVMHEHSLSPRIEISKRHSMCTRLLVFI